MYEALGDKDAAGVVRALAGVVEAWHFAGSRAAGTRGLAVAELQQRLHGAVADGSGHAEVADALRAALAQAAPDGRVLVFGSFHAAAEALRLLGGDA